MKNIQTLHCHSTRSDGRLSYEELLKVCEEVNISTIAFTDHDSLPDIKSINKLKFYSGKTKWIVGIEASANSPKDLIIDSSPHIVGLFINPFDKNLVGHCEKSQDSRRDRMNKIVKNLSNLGFMISEKDCLMFSKGESVGRPHIVQALMKNNENILIQEKIRKDMKKKARQDTKIKDKYDEMMKRGKDQYPYILYLSEDSYIPDIYEKETYSLDLDEIVKLIRDAGGLAFFAHWFTEINKYPEFFLDKLLKENRLDGVETVYGCYDDIKDELVKQRNVLLSLISKNNKLESGGVDAHTKEHLVEFTKDDWFSRLTCNMAETIISKSNVDTKWSSFK